MSVEVYLFKSPTSKMIEIIKKRDGRNHQIRLLENSHGTEKLFLINPEWVFNTNLHSHILFNFSVWFHIAN